MFYLLFSHLLGWEHDDTSLQFWVPSFPTGPNVYWFVINHILYSQQRKQLIGPFCSEIMFLNSMESSPDCRLANRCGSEDREFSPKVYFILWWKQYLLQLSLFFFGALSSHKFMWRSTLGWEIISFFPFTLVEWVDCLLFLHYHIVQQYTHDKSIYIYSLYIYIHYIYI